MNHTKWEELRLAMYGLGELHPKYRVQDLSGYLSPWDGEWYYHFRECGYASMAWVELQIVSPAQHAAVLAALQQIHLPGQATAEGFRIYGYVPAGTFIEYL